MGATISNTKHQHHQFDSHAFSTPPKVHGGSVHNRLVQLQCDPRSPTDGISRTPIQIDNQLPVPPLRLFNHVMPHIVGPDIIITDSPDIIVDEDDDDNQENELRQRQQKTSVISSSTIECDSKRSSGIEPTLDPSKVLTALVANNNGQLPPYQL